MSYTLWRNNPVNGFRETINYEGSLKSKPKGWKVCK